MGLLNNDNNLSKKSDKNKRIFEFLKNNNIGVISTVDPNNEPHSAVVYYSVDEQFQITFTTKQKTKKVTNLSSNNHAMFIVYDPSTQTTVQVTATSENLAGTPELPEIFRATIEASMDSSESGVPPISKLAAGDYTAFRLHPVQIRMAVFGRPDPGGYDEIFETIDF